MLKYLKMKEVPEETNSDVTITDEADVKKKLREDQTEVVKTNSRLTNLLPEGVLSVPHRVLNRQEEVLRDVLLHPEGVIALEQDVRDN